MCALKLLPQSGLLVLALLLSSCGTTRPVFMPSKWGELRERRIVRLKEDMILQGKVVLSHAVVQTARYHQEGVSPEKYKTNPSKWPQLQLVEKGTRFNCRKLKHFNSFEYSRYELWAQVLNGPLKGEEVDIGWLVREDSKGNLELVPRLLEFAD